MPEAKLNPYARLLINEARRRGIGVEIEDEEGGLFALSHGGRRVACRESLSELTSAVALSRCDDKALTHRLLARHNLRVPQQHLVDDPKDARAFLERIGRIVVKPARGEQGRGISVDIDDPVDMVRAIEAAEQVCDKVLLEEFCEGQDLRVIVIGYKVIAAAIRVPATVVGDGESDVRSLIDRQSRRRASATGGESRIPVDAETERCVKAAGFDMEHILPKGMSLPVRKTANLHTGGTIHDVTDDLHPHLRKVAEDGARILEIPVVGFDFLAPDVSKPDYVIIEANERPGLANHEPQPTAEAFISLLFPQTVDRVSDLKEPRHASR
jgi:GNAT-family acetyltransferase (TIGR03103 family)